MNLQALFDHSRGVTRIDGHRTQVEQGAIAFFAVAHGGLDPLALGDVARDLRCADNRAFTVSDGRHRHGHVEQRAVFAAADCVEVAHDLPSADTFEDAAFLFESLWRNQQGDGLTHRFLGSVTKQAFCAAIPTGDDAIDVFTDDCVIGRRDNGG